MPPLVATKKKSSVPKDRLIAQHKKARFEYEILDEVEAGLVLCGTEVKALRNGQASLEEAYVRFVAGEVYLVGTHIPEYRQGNVHNHDPYRRRKCLLRAREIRKLRDQVGQKGLTLVPLKLYWSPRGQAKVELGICKGRKLHDKRHAVRDREARKTIRGGDHGD